MSVGKRVGSITCGAAVGAMSIAVPVNGATASAATAKGSPIEIGVDASLTGEWSFVGVDGVNGMKLAVQQVNSAGGVGGHPLKLIVENDESSESNALPIVSGFISNKSVMAILTGTAIDMAPTAAPHVILPTRFPTLIA